MTYPGIWSDEEFSGLALLLFCKQIPQFVLRTSKIEVQVTVILLIELLFTVYKIPNNQVPLLL